ncbi:hypothetical protein PR202_ga13800 [Eleusine coracana subsp. coracana]|uniref:Uncharacterized protein n=1 Tax=Eleusine coracana subsp. coracana TaxID=191504 RepID=A0AAV5CFY7_ELECO|nr:hypothetical protein PR202_ga13800 [Eleusine coracana subsp. coracana]
MDRAAVTELAALADAAAAVAGAEGDGGGGGAGDVVRAKRAALAACLTCPLCGRLLRDAATIAECLHTCEYCSHRSACLFLSPLGTRASGAVAYAPVLDSLALRLVVKRGEAARCPRRRFRASDLRLL